jgi:acetyltransferase-like isoleucine patch superfamily enzyme
VFGEDVHLLTGKHLNVAEASAANLPLHYVPDSGRDIVIGRHCYLGQGAIVIGPVTIGDYAVVAAGAVVTHDVPPRTMVAGVPAKPIKQL